MKLREIIEFIDEKIPKSLALSSDEIGFKKDYDMNQSIDSIKIYMDLLPEHDENDGNTLIITHHPPLFIPETPTYTIHSNWDIIEGGANDALANALNLKIIGYFDTNTHIGRVCESNQSFLELKNTILSIFDNVRIVNKPDDEAMAGQIGVISGFGLKNPDYITLAKDRNIKILISGDMTQQTAILAKNLGITLIDLNHHESEIPGLYALADVLKELDVNMEIINEKPMEKLEFK